MLMLSANVSVQSFHSGLFGAVVLERIGCLMFGILPDDDEEDRLAGVRHVP